MPALNSSKKPIILIGPMGSGKSTVGRALAAHLQQNFLDLDAKIEADNGMSIPDIFAKFAEAGFRDRETAALQDAAAHFSGVIAAGGGIISREVNCEILKQQTTAVYLYCDVETQYQRTLNDNNRPMIYAADRRARLQELFAVRDPLYRSAAVFQIDSGRLDVAGCVQAITALLDAGADNLQE